MRKQKNQSQSIFLQKFFESGAKNHVEAHFLSLIVESLNANSQTDLLSAPAELSIDPSTYSSMNLPSSSFSSLAAFNIVFDFLESHQLNFTLNSLQNELTNSKFLTKNSNLNVAKKLELNSRKSIIKQLILKSDLNRDNQKVDELSKNAQIRSQVAKKLLSLSKSGNCPALNSSSIQNHLKSTIYNSQRSQNENQISSEFEEDREAVIQLQFGRSNFKSRNFDSNSMNNVDIDSNELQVSSGLIPIGISSDSWNKKREAAINFQEANNFDSNLNDSLNLSELLPRGVSNSKWDDAVRKSVNKLNQQNQTDEQTESPKYSIGSSDEVPVHIDLARSKSNYEKQNTQTLSYASVDLSEIVPNNESPDEWIQKRENAVKETPIAGDNFVPIPHKFISSSTSKANSVCNGGFSNNTDTSSIIPSNYSPSKWNQTKLRIIKKDIEPSNSSCYSIDKKLIKYSSSSSSNLNSTKLSQLSLNEVNMDKETNNAIFNIQNKKRRGGRSRFSSSPSNHSNSTFSKDSKSQLEQLNNLRKAIDYSDSNSKTESSSTPSFNFNEQLNQMILSDSESESNNSTDQSITNSYSSKKIPKAPTLVESSEYERIRQKLKEKVNKTNEFNGFINNLSEYDKNYEEEDTKETIEIKVKIGDTNSIESANSTPKKNKIIRKLEFNDDENNSATLSSDEIKSSTNTAEQNSLKSGKSYTTNLNTSTISANNEFKNANIDNIEEEEEEFIENIDVLNKSGSNLNSTNGSYSLTGFQFTPNLDKTKSVNLKQVVVATSSSSSSSRNLKNVILASSSSSSYESKNENNNNTEEEIYQIPHEKGIEPQKNQNFELEVANSNFGFELPQSENQADTLSSSISSEDNDGFYLSPSQKRNKLKILPNNSNSNKIEYVTQSTDREAILQMPSEREIIQINAPIVKKSDSVTQTDKNVTTPKKRIIKIKKKKTKSKSQEILSASDSSDIDTNDIYLPGVNYENKQKQLPLLSSSSSSAPSKQKETKVLDFEELVKSIPKNLVIKEKHKNESIIIDRLTAFEEEDKTYDLNNDKNTNVIAFEFPENQINDENIVSYEFPYNQNDEEEAEEEEKTEIHIEDEFSFQSNSKYEISNKEDSPKKTVKKIKVVKKIVKKNTNNNSNSAPSSPKPKSQSNSQQSTPKKIIKIVKKVHRSPQSSKSNGKFEVPSPKKKRKISHENLSNLLNQQKNDDFASSNFTNDVERDISFNQKTQPIQAKEEEEEKTEISSSQKTVKLNGKTQIKTINSTHSDSSDSEKDETKPKKRIPHSASQKNKLNKYKQNEVNKNKSLTPIPSHSKSPKIQFVSPRVAAILGNSDSVIISDDDSFDLRNTKPIHLRRKKDKKVENKEPEQETNHNKVENKEPEQEINDNKVEAKEPEHENNDNKVDKIENKSNNNDEEKKENIINNKNQENTNESESFYEEDSQEEIPKYKFLSPTITNTYNTKKEITPIRKKPANFSDIFERYEAEEAQKKDKEEKNQMQIQKEKDDQEEVQYQLISDINHVVRSSDSTFSAIEATAREESINNKNQLPEIIEEEEEELETNNNNENETNNEEEELETKNNNNDETNNEEEENQQEPESTNIQSEENVTNNKNEENITNNENEENKSAHEYSENDENRFVTHTTNKNNNYDNFNFKEEEEESNEIPSMIFEITKNDQFDDNNNSNEDDEDSTMNQSLMNIFGKKEQNELKQEQAVINLPPEEEDENKKEDNSNSSESEDQSNYVALSPRNPIRKKNAIISFNLNPLNNKNNTKERDAPIQNEPELISESEKIENSDLIPISPINPNNRSLTKPVKQPRSTTNQSESTLEEIDSIEESENQEIEEEEKREKEKEIEIEKPYEYAYLNLYKYPMNNQIYASSTSTSKPPEIVKKKLTFEEVMERAEQKIQNEKKKEIQFNIDNFEEEEEDSSIDINNVPISESSNAITAKEFIDNKFDSNAADGILNISSIHHKEESDNENIQNQEDQQSDATIDSSSSQNQQNANGKLVEEEEEKSENSADYASSSSISMFSEEFEKIKDLPISSKHRTRAEKNAKKKFSDTSFISFISCGESEFNYKDGENKPKKKSKIEKQPNNDNQNQLDASSSFFSVEYDNAQNKKNPKKENNSRVRFDDSVVQNGEEVNNNNNLSQLNDNSSSLFSNEFNKIQNKPIRKQNNNNESKQTNNNENNNDKNIEDNQPLQNNNSSLFSVEYDNAQNKKNPKKENNSRIKFDNSVVQNREEINNNNNNLSQSNDNSSSLFSNEFNKIQNKPIRKQNNNNESKQTNNNENNNDKNIEDNQPLQNNNSSSLFSVEYDKIKDKKFRRNKQEQEINDNIQDDNNDQNNENNFYDNSSSSFFSVEYDKIKDKKIKRNNNDSENKEHEKQINDNSEPEKQINNNNNSTSFFSAEYDKIKDKKFERYKEEENETEKQTDNNNNQNNQNSFFDNSTSFFSAEYNKIKDKQLINKNNKQEKSMKSDFTIDQIETEEDPTNQNPINNKNQKSSQISGFSNIKQNHFEKEKSETVDEYSFFTDEFEKVEPSSVQKKQIYPKSANNDESISSILKEDNDNIDNKTNKSKSILISELENLSNSENEDEQPTQNYNYTNKRSFIESSSFFASLSDDFNKEPPSRFIKKKGKLDNSSDDLISEITDGISDSSDEDKNKKIHQETISNNLQNNIESRNSTFSDDFDDDDNNNNNRSSKFIKQKDKNESSSIIDSVSYQSDKPNQTAETKPNPNNKQNVNSSFSNELENNSQSNSSNGQRFIKKNKNSRNDSTISSISGGNSSLSQIKSSQKEISISTGVGFNLNVSQEASSFFSKNFEKSTNPKNQNQKENDTISSFSSISQQPNQTNNENQEETSQAESKSEFLEQISSISNLDQSQQQQNENVKNDANSSGDEFILPTPKEYLEDQQKLMEKEEKKRQKNLLNSPQIQIQEKPDEEEHSAHVVVLPHPSSGKKKRRHNSSISKQKTKSSIDDSSSSVDEKLENEYYYSDDEKVGDSSSFSFHLRKMPRPPTEISSSSFNTSNSKSPIQTSKINSNESAHSTENKEENEMIEKSSSFSEDDFINQSQTNEYNKTTPQKNVQINIKKNVNRVRNEIENPNQDISNDSSNLDNKKSQNPTSYNDAESSDFLFTSEQRKESSKKHDSLDPIDSDNLFENSSKTSQKKLANNDQENPNSFACTLDDESIIDNISGDEDLSIIPKMDSGSLQPSQRSEIILDDLEDISNGDDEKNEQAFSETVEEEEVDDKIENNHDLKQKPININNNSNQNSSSLISASQINGDNAFGQVKQIKNGSGADVEGIIEAPSDFDF